MIALLRMKGRRTAWLALLLAVLAAAILCYSLLHRSAYGRVVVEPDVINVNSRNATQAVGSVGYEPYFNKANPVPTEVKFK